VLAGSLASGIGAYAFQVLGTRGLGEEAYAPISVLWTIQYLTLSIPLIAIEAYITRSVARRMQQGEGTGLRRALRVLTVWLLVTAGLLGAVTYIGRDALLGGFGDLALVSALIVLSYGAFVIVRGQMAGMDRFRSYGGATGLESISRVVLAGIVLAVVPTTQALAYILPVGPILVLAWWLWDGRAGGHTRAPEDTAAAPLAPELGGLEQQTSSGAIRFLAITTTANGAAQILLAAGPLILIPLGASAAEVSIFFVTATAARAPLAFALGGVLSRLLPPLVRLASAGQVRALRRVALQIAAAAVLVALTGAAGAAWIGPELIGLFFGAAFTPGRTFTVLTVLGVLLCTGALLINQVLIAQGLERRLLLPWLSGLTAAAVVVIAVPDATPTLRVTYGFITGVSLALAGLLVTILSSAASSPAAGSATSPASLPQPQPAPPGPTAP
jgi:O-antigen/teichoic acid export membrane protein